MKKLLFKNKNFRLLMLGQLISILGDNAQSFALSLYVLKVTGSATKFVSVLALTIIPQLILGPVAGVFADWFDRKKIVVFIDLVNTAIVGIYVAIAYFTGSLNMISIYILAIVLSIASLITTPAISSILPSVVEKEDLVEANSINSMIYSTATLVAPAIAGVMMQSLGIDTVLLINCLSFLFAAICKIMMKVPKYNRRPEKINLAAFKADFNEGIKYIKSSKIMIVVISLAAAVNFALNPLLEVGVLYIFKKKLLVNDINYGVIQTIMSSCTIIAPMVTGYISKKLRLGQIIFYNTAFIAILTFVTGAIIFRPFFIIHASPVIPCVLITIAFSLQMMLLVIVNIFIGSFMQKYVPMNMLGRIGTVMSTVVRSAIPIGLMVFGLLYDSIPTWITTMISGAVLLTVIIIFKRRILSMEESVREA